MGHDRKEYLKKKRALEKLVTIYGRNAVLEALEDLSITPTKLHLSISNKPAPIIKKMESLAKKRDIEIAYHDKASL